MARLQMQHKELVHAQMKFNVVRKKKVAELEASPSISCWSPLRWTQTSRNRPNRYKVVRRISYKVDQKQRK
jgi:hypothetical protein